MAKFSFKDGKFVNKETGEAVSSLSGKIAAIEQYATDSGLQKIRIRFASETEGQEGDSLSFKKVGDAALKIVRCLYGIADIIGQVVITISLEAREGSDKKAISVLADDCVLIPLGRVEPYASEKILLTDRILAVLTRALTWSRAVLVYNETDTAIAPESFEEVLESIAAHKRNGTLDAVKIRHTVFNNEHAYNGYVKGIRDSIEGSLARVYEGTAADAILEAYNAPLEETEEAPAPGDDDEC